MAESTTRAAAKFIEKTHDLFPTMIYSNISAVGASTLADELMLLGPRFTQNVMVTQTVPAVGGASSTVLEYKNALSKYAAGEPPDYISLEGYIMANVLIDALRRCGPQIDTEKLVDVLEETLTVQRRTRAVTPPGTRRARRRASKKGHERRRNAQLTRTTQ